MKKKFLVTGCFITMIAAALAGCGQKDSKPLPDLSGMGEVQVIAREDGSGTRTEFENLVGSTEAGTDRLAASTQEMQEIIAQGKNAVGYVAYSALTPDSQAKILSVSSVTPDIKTIQNGKYPLCRNYYLAYMGELSDLGKDFLTYILGAGQAQVADYCITVHKTTTFLSDKSCGTLTIQGSSSVAPLMKALIKDYKTYNPNANIELTISDSTAGLTAAIRGECDLAMSSRILKNYETTLLETETIASDAIVVAVNPANPLTDISIEQLREIYDGKTISWNDMKQ